ncbi:MAG: LuxR C-terminal-related transcriptional regulator [Bacteroidales bacterium]|jgi:DNA-binding NarL/FixJ family response regulator|nr:LuxR C-terminal-related transcriptional regulator [Bacteroidales bacterium]
MNYKVRIAIAEPSVIIRTGLLTVLKRLTSLSMEVFELTEIDNLEVLLIKHRPDILIINPIYLDSNTLSALKHNNRFASIKYVALQTTMLNIHLLKQYDQIINTTLNAEQIKEIISKLIVTKDNASSFTLSEREKDIVIAIAEGLTNKEIADKLHISTNTVMTHRKNISNKLNIHSPAGLILYAIANKLIEIN